MCTCPAAPRGQTRWGRASSCFAAGSSRAAMPTTVCGVSRPEWPVASRETGQRGSSDLRRGGMDSTTGTVEIPDALKVVFDALEQRFGDRLLGNDFFRGELTFTVAPEDFIE